MPADANPLLTPETTALLLVDQQAGLAFGVSSIDRQTLLNNTIALARTAVVFKLPVVVSTSASKVYSGPLMPAVAQVLPGVQPIERRNMNLWEDETARRAVSDTGRRRLLVSGLLTEACVSFPVLSALASSYEVFVVADACGGLTPVSHDLALRRMESARGSHDLLDSSSTRIAEGLDTARDLRRRAGHRGGPRWWLRNRTGLRA